MGISLMAVSSVSRRFSLAGGMEPVWWEIENLRGKGEYQWALQLLDRLIHAGEDVDRASAAKAAVLRDHAVGQIKCPTRHY